MTCECGTCATCRARVRMARYRRAHPERAREQTARYREAHREQLRAYDRERGFRPGSPEKRHARNLLNSAVRRGLIVRPDVCEVDGCPNVPEGHHDDYSRPLDVRWLCPKHHGIEHRQDQDEERRAA